MNYNLSIEATDNNIKEALENDLLNNNEWIRDFINLISNFDNSIISIDGSWGSGKTFLSKEISTLINQKWEFSFYGKQYTINPKNLKFDELNIESTFAIYYNAWEYDNDNDPIYSFLYYLLHILNKNIIDKGDKLLAVTRNLIKNVLEKISGGWIKIDSSTDDKLKESLNSVLTTEYIKLQIQELIKELKSEKCNKLVIIIDELDRCRPSYALKMIESIIHYLKQEGILVICTTDANQLTNMIKTAYGTNYDANLYLDKIFDFNFDVPHKYNLKKYSNYKIGKGYDSEGFLETIFEELVITYNLSLRNIDRLLMYLKPFIQQRNNDISFEEFKPIALVIYFFTPYLIVTKLFNKDEYKDLIGLNFNNLLKFITREKVFNKMSVLYNEFELNKNSDNPFLKDMTTLLCYYNKRASTINELNVGRIRGFSVSHYIDDLYKSTYFINEIQKEINDEKRF